MKERILVIDDETEILENLETILSDEGFEVVKASSGNEALANFEVGFFGLVITDMKMPDLSGIDVLRHVKLIDEEVEVIILTGHATLENAIMTLRDEGAYDYLLKPLEQIEGLLISVNHALERRGLRLENKVLLKKLSEANEELEHRVAERTMQLKETIAMLEAEIAERKRAVEEWEKLQQSVAWQRRPVWVSP
ncbi:MAG: response regulator [Desulfatiglandaceae bacterium]